MRSLIASLLASLLSLSSLPALAESTKDAASGSEPVLQALCADKESREIGRCVSDTLKNWNRIFKDFKDASEIAHRDWHKKNDALGITDEATKAHREFHETMKKRQKEFQTQRREMHRVLKNQQDAKRGDGLGKRRTSQTDKTRFGEAEKECAKQTDRTGYRACVYSKIYKQKVQTRQTRSASSASSAQ